MIFHQDHQLINSNADPIDPGFFNKEVSAPGETVGIETPKPVSQEPKNAPFNFMNLEGMDDVLDGDLNGDLDEEAYLNTIIVPKTKKATPVYKGKLNFENNIKLMQHLVIYIIEDITMEEEHKLVTIESENLMHTKLDIFLGSGIENEGNNLDIQQLEPYVMKKTKSQNFNTSEFTFSGSKSIQSLNNHQKDQILLHLLKERGCYKEKLRLAESEIMTREYRIEKLKKDSSAFPVDISEAGIHLAFLFSSPLIRRTNVAIENIMQLDYLTEINDILKV